MPNCIRSEVRLLLDQRTCVLIAVKKCIMASRGGLKLYGAPCWNLERGPFLYTYENLNERIELLVLLKQMKLEQKKRIIN